MGEDQPSPLMIDLVDSNVTGDGVQRVLLNAGRAKVTRSASPKESVSSIGEDVCEPAKLSGSIGSVSGSNKGFPLGNHGVGVVHREGSIPTRILSAGDIASDGVRDVGRINRFQ